MRVRTVGTGFSVPGRVRDERGVAAVEFAVITPLLLLILAGVIQFGVIYSQYQVLQGAAREGARCASVQASSNCNVLTEVTNAALGYTLSSSPTVTVAGAPGTCTNSTIGRDVTVSWNQNFGTGPLLGLVPGMPSTISKTISGTFRCE